MSIVNIEATLRCSSGTERAKIKETLIGAGGIVAINIFYYSHALLYRYINMNLISVKAGIVLISILFIAYALLRNNVMDVQVVVSRRVVYRSISIFIVAMYLVGIGIMGKGLMYVDPQVGENITVFLAFAGMIAIVTVVFSEQLRRKALVLINKNFYRHKYDYREQWLRFTQRISLKHSYDGLLDSIAQGFKDAIGFQSVAIWLDDKGNGEFVCVKAVDKAESSTGPNKELVNFLKEKQWVLYIHDPKCSDTVLKSTEFIERNEVCLIVPLLHRDKLVGFIVLGEALANVEYNYEDYDLLKTLARQATAAILNARLSEELIDAKEMEAIGKLSSFVIHDLKNASSMLTMLAQNAEEHIENPEFQKDAIHGISNTSEKIKGITMKLKNLHQKTTVNLEYDDLGMCVKGAVSEFSLNENIRLNYVENEIVETKFDKEEIHKVVVNLIMNALDATGDKGHIDVVVGKENNIPFIKVSDNGCGMSQEFVEKDLFKPFRTSKKKGLGIGLYQCKTIVEDHSGKIRVNSVEGKGTDIIIYLPSYIV
jgi:putative PEP-CTERM system histidine kinase